MTRLQRLLLALGIILLAPACTKTVTVPGEPVEVRVPVPVPCEPVEVPRPELPRADPDAGIYDRAAALLAQRSILFGHVERLEAANRNPCPEETTE